VNETYRSYNSAQTPFVVLDFKVPKDSIDINVSPDKKTIYLHSEANLIESLAVSGMITMQSMIVGLNQTL
jgi:DNA mismatch repair protein PMS2